MKDLVCEACWVKVFNTKVIQNFWIRESQDFSYSTNWSQIFQSAEKACNWCGFLRSVLPSPDCSQWPAAWTPATKLLVVLDEAILMAGTSPKGFNHCQIDFYAEGSSRPWVVELDLFVDDPNDAAGIVTARPMQSKVSSNEACLQVSSWLDQCDQHGDCPRVQSEAKLPTRAIEVAPADSPSVPRLQSTTGMKGSYIALSYCWGSHQSYVLTTKNLEPLMRELEVTELPQTISDAIQVTKALGLKYLWVDALCIMQDSVEEAASQDMEKELETMDQVYKNATMTIVAACASSVAEGFLHERNHSGQRRFDIPCRVAHNQFFVAHIQEHINYDDHNEPINARAWTFQEQILSPRLLIYATHSLQWQCSTVTCNLGDSYHSPLLSAAPRLLAPQGLAIKDDGKNVARHQSKCPNVSHHTLQHWLSIVQSYSTRKLSLPSDKLPALSALAMSYSPIFGPGYHAGIWEGSAMQQLCWRTPDSRRFFTRPTQYRAPSWSWAALDGPIYFPSYLEIEGASACLPLQNFNIIEWEVRLKSDRLPYGEVLDGKLTVMTVIKNATYDPSSSPNLRFEAEEPSAAPKSNYSPQGVSDTAEDNFPRHVRCLPIYRDAMKKSDRVGGLLVVESSAGSGLFRRLGTFTAENSTFRGGQLATTTII